VTTALLITLAASVSWSLFDGFRKALVTDIPSGRLVVLLSLGQVPVFAGWLLWAGGAGIAAPYWAPAAGSVVLNVVANYLFLESVRLSPLSLTVPLLALTPAFTALVAIPIVGEAPALGQWGGILLVVVGAFTLNARPSDLRRPRRLLSSLVRERGSVLMILVAALWSVTSSLDKVALRSATPPMHALLLALGVAAGMLIVLALKRDLGLLADVRRRPLALLGGVISVTLAMAFQLTAIQLALVSFVEAVKRATGITLSQVIGRVAFAEPLSRVKLLSAGVITLGVLALLLG
jgi:drug/metabolite transporter (DMT)-like permease